VFAAWMSGNSNERPILLAVDQEVGDMEELGAGSMPEASIRLRIPRVVLVGMLRETNR
jgi:hypothetical protein